MSALFLTRVRVREVPPPAEQRRTLLAELAEGFGHVRSRSWLWVTVVVFALAVPLANAPLFVLGPTVAEDSYDSAALFGIVTTLFGAGAVAGALAGLRWRPRHPMRAAFLVLAGWPALLVVFGAGAPVAILVVVAFGDGPRVRALRRLVEHRDGRAHPCACAFAGELLRLDGLAVLLPVGFLVAGPLAEATSAETVMILGGVLTAVVLALGLIPRQTRTLERIEHADWSASRGRAAAPPPRWPDRPRGAPRAPAAPARRHRPPASAPARRRRRTAARPSTSLRRLRPRRSSSVPACLMCSWWASIAAASSSTPFPSAASVFRIGTFQSVTGPERQHAADLAHHRVGQRVVRLVHDDHVRDLHHAGLQRLHGVARARHQHEHDRVGVVDDVDLGLADADRLHQHVVLARGVHQQHRLERGLRQAAERPAARHRADVDALVEEVLGQPDPVAQQGALRERAGRVDRQHRHLALRGAGVRDAALRSACSCRLRAGR